MTTITRQYANGNFFSNTFQEGAILAYTPQETVTDQTPNLSGANAQLGLPNWTQMPAYANNVFLSGNSLREGPHLGELIGSYWTGSYLNSDQWIQATINWSDYATYFNLYLRGKYTSNQHSGYLIQGSPTYGTQTGHMNLYWRTNDSTFGEIGTGNATTFANGDVVLMTAIGSNISVWRNGLLYITGIDTHLSAGAPGIGIAGGTNGNTNVQLTAVSFGHFLNNNVVARIYPNGNTQLINMIELGSGTLKVYANGTAVCNTFHEA